MMNAQGWEFPAEGAQRAVSSRSSTSAEDARCATSKVVGLHRRDSRGCSSGTGGGSSTARAWHGFTRVTGRLRPVPPFRRPPGNRTLGLQDVRVRFLFTFAGGAGHFLPTVPIASAVRRRGHEVMYGCQPAMRRVVEQAGFPAYPTGGHSLLEPGARRPLVP